MDMNENLSYIHPNAKIGKNVTIEPFCYIAENVIIGDGCHIGPNATIFDYVRMGAGCQVFPGAVIGAIPQDLKYDGEESWVEIGERTTVRECATINRGTAASGKRLTRVGSDCLIMSYAHIAHDCCLGDHCIVVTHAGLAGETILGDWAIVGGGTDGQVESLRKAGLSMGVAFQLKDDLLNVEGAEAITGKDAFSDLVEGKRTTLVSHALEHSPRADELLSILDRGAVEPGDTRLALDILEEAGSIGYVQSLMEKLCEDAKSSLMGQFGESAARSTLCVLVDYLKDRMH